MTTTHSFAGVADPAHYILVGGCPSCVSGLCSSEASAGAAVRAAALPGNTRRLLVELRIPSVDATDARGELDAMRSSRGDPRQLDILAELYSRGSDVSRVDGPEGELDIIFTVAIGDSLRIPREANVSYRRR